VEEGTNPPGVAALLAADGVLRSRADGGSTVKTGHSSAAVRGAMALESIKSRAAPASADRAPSARARTVGARSAHRATSMPNSRSAVDSEVVAAAGVVGCRAARGRRSSHSHSVLSNSAIRSTAKTR